MATTKNSNFFNSDPFEDTNLRIVTCYHKPSVLPETTDFFLPIHVGRALAEISHPESIWLNGHMIGDDTGENISDRNQRYCELTAVYWAWKNYEKLGNPDFIGLSHYRRVFDFRGTSFDQKSTDIIVASPWHSSLNAYDQYKNTHNIKDLEIAIGILIKKYPAYKQCAEKYLKSHGLCLLNMFIMRKELFFHYADWLFPLLDELDQNLDYSYRSTYDLRTVGFIAERLQDIFVSKLKEEGYSVKYLPFSQLSENELTLSLVFESIPPDGNVVVTSCDDGYALYAGVLLASIKATMRNEMPYYIFILDSGISSIHKEKIKLLESSNFKINFVDMAAYWKRFNTGLLKTYSRIPKATYARFFIPEIFNQFEKVVYLDPDMIACDSLNNLFNIEFDGELLAACSDIEAVRCYNQDKKFRIYIDNTLRLSNGNNYFQAGLIVFNIKELLAFDFAAACFDLANCKALKYLDQCTLNKVCEGRVKFLDIRWNIQCNLFNRGNQFSNQIDHRISEQVLNSIKSPGIIHFCGEQKPWTDLDNKFAEYFWGCARMTPFYEKILYQCQQKNISGRNNLKDKYNYYRYRLLSKITFGKTRKKYKIKSTSDV